MMKITAFVSFLVFFCFSFVFSLEPAASQSVGKANELIKSRAFLEPQGYTNLGMVSESIPEFYRNELYKTHEKFWLGAFALNFFLPGVGSWTMGDWVGALTVELGMAASLGAVFLSLGYYRTSSGYAVNLIGGLACMGFYIANLVIPFTYGISWNIGLRNGLKLAASPSGVMIALDF